MLLTLNAKCNFSKVFCFFPFFFVFNSCFINSFKFDRVSLAFNLFVERRRAFKKLLLIGWRTRWSRAHFLSDKYFEKSIKQYINTTELPWLASVFTFHLYKIWKLIILGHNLSTQNRSLLCPSKKCVAHTSSTRSPHKHQRIGENQILILEPSGSEAVF